MDPRYSGEALKHLEKQNELLMEAYNSMSHELHKLQVEEEMLMRKFYEFMAAQGFAKKNDRSTSATDGGQAEDSTASLTNATSESVGGENGQSIALVPFSDEQQS